MDSRSSNTSAAQEIMLGRDAIERERGMTDRRDATHDKVLTRAQSAAISALRETELSMNPPEDTPRPLNDKLPIELLNLIMNYAVPPREFLDASLSAGDTSPWCQNLRTKKSLTLVCKAWWAAGMQLLYSDVAFRRLGQIVAFLETMNTSAFAVEAAVHSIEVNCWVPKQYTQVYLRDLHEIVHRCRGAHTLIYGPFWDSQDVSTREMCISAHAALSNITHLDCSHRGSDQGVDFSLLVTQILDRTSPNLASLSFNAHANIWPDDASNATRPLSFPRLTNLRIVSPESRPFAALARVWALPALTHLTLDVLRTDATSPSPPLPLSPLAAFLRAHGAHLSFLHVHSACQPSPMPFGDAEHWDVQPLLDLCPALAHLVVHTHVALPLRHAALRWVDVETHRSLANLQLVRMREFLTAEHLPALCGVRILDRALAGVPGLAYTLPPLEADADTREFRWPGVHVRWARRGVYKTDMAYFDSLAADLFRPDTLHRPPKSECSDSEDADDEDGSEVSVDVSEDDPDADAGVWRDEEHPYVDDSDASDSDYEEDSSGFDESVSSSDSEDYEADVYPVEDELGAADQDGDAAEGEEFDDALALQLFRLSLEDTS